MTDPEKLTTEDWIARQRAILDKWGVCPILSWVRDALEEEAERLKKHEQAEAIRIEAVAGVIDRARQNVSVVTDLVNAAVGARARP